MIQGLRWLTVEKVSIGICRNISNYWISRDDKEDQSNQDDYHRQKLNAKRQLFGDRENTA